MPMNNKVTLRPEGGLITFRRLMVGGLFRVANTYDGVYMKIAGAFGASAVNLESGRTVIVDPEAEVASISTGEVVIVPGDPA
jgi:hypothetical protein